MIRFNLSNFLRISALEGSIRNGLFNCNRIGKNRKELRSKKKRAIKVKEKKAY